MIRHIVFFTVREANSPEEVRERLTRLAKIPYSRKLEVSLNMKSDPLSNEIDIVVYAEFASASDLTAYRNHPIYAEVTREVRAMRELRFSANFETG